MNVGQYGLGQPFRDCFATRSLAHTQRVGLDALGVSVRVVTNTDVGAS